LSKMAPFYNIDGPRPTWPRS